MAARELHIFALHKLGEMSGGPRQRCPGLDKFDEHLGEIEGVEVVIKDPSLKRTRKGKKGASSSTSKAGPTMRFGAKAVEDHGLTWFNTQKEAKYAPENWIDEVHLELDFPAIRDKIRELGAGYIFNEQERRNLILVREFYTSWDTSFGESTKIKIRGQVVRFTAKRFNAFLEKPSVDPLEYFILLVKPPYRDICHTLCGEQSYNCCAKDHNGTHSTLAFAYLNREAK
ncbi:hypothetical protein HAX54_042069, partial [Datura stramonium]|nr:hypothetical protein [Datura stramonium]